MKTPPELDTVRIDKWLWAARLYKTRSIAKDMVNAGKVTYNDQRVKASKTVSSNAELTVTQGYIKKTIIIDTIFEKRQSAPIAATMYHETAKSIEARAAEEILRKSLPKLETKDKPDKKQRRILSKLKHNNY